jgi:Co/Zn/Cd efflux system component
MRKDSNLKMSLTTEDDLLVHEPEASSIINFPQYPPAYPQRVNDAQTIVKSNRIKNRCDDRRSQEVQINDGNINVYLIVIGLKMVFVLIEVIIWLLNNSMALLTDAGHNFSDVVSLVISVVALWMAKKQSSAHYTYGFKKTTVLAAFVSAIVLPIAIGILAHGAFSRLFNPEVVSGGVI